MYNYLNKLIILKKNKSKLKNKKNMINKIDYYLE